MLARETDAAAAKGASFNFWTVAATRGPHVLGAKQRVVPEVEPWPVISRIHESATT